MGHGRRGFRSPRASRSPDLEPVRLVSATLTPVAPASGSVCATSLDIEFLWDWRIRTPQQITFVARMYAAATHGTPPPSLALPAGFDRSLAGGGAALVVTFSGAVPSAPGATIIPLTEDGENNAGSFGAAQGSDTRRYRLTLSGHNPLRRAFTRLNSTATTPRAWTSRCRAGRPAFISTSCAG